MMDPPRRAPSIVDDRTAPILRVRHQRRHSQDGQVCCATDYRIDPSSRAVNASGRHPSTSPLTTSRPTGAASAALALQHSSRPDLVGIKEYALLVAGCL